MYIEGNLVLIKEHHRLSVSTPLCSQHLHDGALELEKEQVVGSAGSVEVPGSNPASPYVLKMCYCKGFANISIERHKRLN
jgi:hypothetical protein